MNIYCDIYPNFTRNEKRVCKKLFDVIFTEYGTVAERCNIFKDDCEYIINNEVPMDSNFFAFLVIILEIFLLTNKYSNTFTKLQYKDGFNMLKKMKWFMIRLNKGEYTYEDIK